MKLRAAAVRNVVIKISLMRDKQYIIEKANGQQRDLIISLLRSANLPTEDLPDSLDNFLVSVNDGQLIGAIGLEKYENCGLLRSLVVDKAFRSKHLGSAMVESLEENAIGLGIDSIYLLTETAPDYFEKKGYKRISRDEVPATVKTSSEFGFVCPVSAIVMKKSMR
jgi:amino-acid N-acetyltransferase